MLNSTSGTTGMPKCVTQFDNRWLYFSRLAIEGGSLGPDDVFLGGVPAPFGFGLWTSHYTPAVLGVPTVVLPTFTVENLIRAVETERVTVLREHPVPDAVELPALGRRRPLLATGDVHRRGGGPLTTAPQSSRIGPARPSCSSSGPTRPAP